MINKFTKNHIADSLSAFIWDFKIGDNIIYNLKILYVLYKDKEDSATPDLYNKPISIIIVAIIEAIFYDLVCRLDIATSHFPSHISREHKLEIKSRIEKEKVIYPKKSSMKRIKNYSMKEFIAFFKEYELLGKKDSVLYTHLEKATQMRNRLHIPNYHRNFESDESEVFKTRRLNAIENILGEVIQTMNKLYQRPFESGQSETWLEQLNSV